MTSFEIILIFTPSKGWQKFPKRYIKCKIYIPYQNSIKSRNLISTEIYKCIYLYLFKIMNVFKTTWCHPGVINDLPSHCHALVVLLFTFHKDKYLTNRILSLRIKIVNVLQLLANLMTYETKIIIGIISRSKA